MRLLVLGLIRPTRRCVHGRFTLNLTSSKANVMWVNLCSLSTDFAKWRVVITRLCAVILPFKYSHGRICTPQRLTCRDNSRKEIPPT